MMYGSWLRMSKRQLWLCSEELDTSDSIVCESCLEWYHLKCVGHLRKSSGSVGDVIPLNFLS